MSKELKMPFIMALVLVVVALGVWWYFVSRAEVTKEVRETNGAARAVLEWSGATLKTNYGNIEIVFLVDKAPKTVANFTKLAEEGFYNSTTFHRIIFDFMIQGGDPLSKGETKKAFWGTGGPGYQFGDEINDEKMVRGVVAMANAGPNTNGSQFFIITARETPWLVGKHTVFAKVTAGMEVALAISRADTDERDVPRERVVVEQVILR
jgi:peptidyl-prolyl cis-trans isomerase B (cyclophilin B)